MNIKKTTLCTAIGLAMGGVSLSANANLTTSATLSFVQGTAQTTGCILNTPPPCANTLFNVTDIVGSWFAMGPVGPATKTGIGSFNGIHIGTTQAASGSHPGAPDGSEVPNIDNPWLFTSNTGMHQTVAPITVSSDQGSTKILDMSGWNVTWNGIPQIPLVPLTPSTMVCSTSSCSDTSTYTLDGTWHVDAPSGFTTVTYTLHLEGHVSAIPVPAAAWLFGSGLLGLAGVARRRKSNKA